MLTYQTLAAGEEMFTHVDDDGTQTVFHVRSVLELTEALLSVQEVEVVRVTVDRKFAKFCRESRGIERHRLKALLKNPEHWDPVIFAEQLDGSYLLIDGHHRYVEAASRFRKTIKAVVLRPDHWITCVVHDAPAVDPDALLVAPSGITRN